MTEEIYISEKGLAQKWGLSPKTLQRWRWLKTGPSYIKIGGRVRYSSTNIKKFEEESHHQSKSPDSSSCVKDLSIDSSINLSAI